MPLISRALPPILPITPFMYAHKRGLNCPPIMGRRSLVLNTTSVDSYVYVWGIHLFLSSPRSISWSYPVCILCHVLCRPYGACTPKLQMPQGLCPGLHLCH